MYWSMLSNIVYIDFYWIWRRFTSVERGFVTWTEYKHCHHCSGHFSKFDQDFIHQWCTHFLFHILLLGWHSCCVFGGRMLWRKIFINIVIWFQTHNLSDSNVCMTIIKINYTLKQKSENIQQMHNHDLNTDWKSMLWPKFRRQIHSGMNLSSVSDILHATKHALIWIGLQNKHDHDVNYHKRCNNDKNGKIDAAITWNQ